MSEFNKYFLFCLTKKIRNIFFNSYINLSLFYFSIGGFSF